LIPKLEALTGIDIDSGQIPAAPEPKLRISHEGQNRHVAGTHSDIAPQHDNIALAKCLDSA
jgi:hypothetical protein